MVLPRGNVSKRNVKRPFNPTFFRDPLRLYTYVCVGTRGSYPVLNFRNYYSGKI